MSDSHVSAPLASARTLYLVVGSTGEYSDRVEWFVAAYADQAKAETHALLAKAFGATCRREHGRYDYANPYDKQFQLDYTGTDYYVADIEMRDDVPQGEVKA